MKVLKVITFIGTRITKRKVESESSFLSWSMVKKNKASKAKKKTFRSWKRIFLKEQIRPMWLLRDPKVQQKLLERDEEQRPRLPCFVQAFPWVVLQRKRFL